MECGDGMENPKRIGKYELEEFLGGGMSHVYKARDTLIGRTVAIKILTPEASADPDAKARFLREAQMAGNIAHENIMSVYDFGEEEGQPFMVMEFLRGEDLRSALKNGRTGDLANRLNLALQVAKALGYIHQQKIIHRDIKPENIHVTTGGTVKLVDFGIAKMQDLSLTQPGLTMGTPYYMAPEQVTAREVTHLADIYAFGILLFEVLTGKRPIEGDTVEQLFYQILNEPIDLTPLRQTDCPESIAALIEKCVAKKAADRPQDMRIVQREIERALQPKKAPAPVEPPKQKHRGLAAAVSLIVVLAVALGLFVALRKKDNPVPPPPPKKELSATLSTPTGAMVLIQGGSIPAFYLDRTEVTQDAYRRFCSERQRPLPPGFKADQPGLPMVNVTIVDAQEFAKWAGKRLPNRTEWVLAAQGKDGRAYPWGNQRDPSLANVSDNTTLSTRALMPVESFESGASPFGMLQMAGNAWEFVDQLITPSDGALKAFGKIMSPPPTADEPWYTIHGGAFDVPLIENAASEWSAVPARFRAPDIGFRCAKTPEN
jgi:eukaryotic-like serine/threonine-protein kinase